MLTLKINDQDLRFEHSLVSLSDWEAEKQKPFFSEKKDHEKTEDDMMSYFEYMLVSPMEQRHLVRLMSDSQKLALAEYINHSRTATTVKEIQQQRGPKENVTSELIYYWMLALKIPFKPTDEWHLSRLLMLVKICGVKNAKPTKEKKSEIARNYREINERRRKELGTRG